MYKSKAHTYTTGVANMPKRTSQFRNMDGQQHKKQTLTDLIQPFEDEIDFDRRDTEDTQSLIYDMYKTIVTNSKVNKDLHIYTIKRVEALEKKMMEIMTHTGTDPEKLLKQHKTKLFDFLKQIVNDEIEAHHNISQFMEATYKTSKRWANEYCVENKLTIPLVINTFEEAVKTWVLRWKSNFKVGHNI